MKTSVAIDVSGLAWRYRTGVQNLYWAFVDAWSESPGLHDQFDLSFYDRSGSFNRAVERRVGGAYSSSAPGWWPTAMRRPLQALVRTSGLLGPRLGGVINHVWNWSIFAPPACVPSITIPDLLPLEHPEWFDARFCRLSERSIRFATQARHVFAISHDVKRRLCSNTGLPEARVRVVYPGIDAAYLSGSASVDAQQLLTRHGLRQGGYLLSSGFLDPRKNLARQLTAFGIAVSRGLSGYKYALTGLRTALSNDVMKIIESPAMRDRVVFLGYVPKDELVTLTACSAALMYCSIAEGFGLPIVEAMAAGAPVITSATTSMQELAHSRARLVNPEDEQDIAVAIEETLNEDAEGRTARIQANRAFAARFTIHNWLGGHLDAFAGADHQDRWK